LTRVNVECVPCIIDVRAREVLMRYSGSDLRAVRFISELARKYAELVEQGMLDLTLIATELFRDVKRFLNDPDPYRRVKAEANENGLKLYSRLKDYARKLDGDERLVLAVRAALLGNSLDLGVSGYSPPGTDELMELLNKIEILGLGEISVLRKVRGKTITYLLDNAGEAALDRLLAEELRARGAYVIAVVKSGSFQNDVTVNEVKELKLSDSFDDIIPTGSDGSSIFFNEVSGRLKEVLTECDLIISKGMAHYEYLSNYEDKTGKQILYMLRAKCGPIARELSVPKNAFVIRGAYIYLDFT